MGNLGQESHLISSLRKFYFNYILGLKFGYYGNSIKWLCDLWCHIRVLLNQNLDGSEKDGKMLNVT